MVQETIQKNYKKEIMITKWYKEDGMAHDEQLKWSVQVTKLRVYELHI